MNKHLLFLFFLFSIYLYPNKANSQLIIENTQTVEELVQDVLAGQGVVVSNVTINGQPGNQVNVQVGFFNSDSSNIGIDEGVILASGGVNGAIGPNDSGSNSEPGSGDMYSDPDIVQIISPFDANDVVSVEFDFIPNGDTLVFNYVFGSEEYNEFVCSIFTDAFGFFISGPGISGPFSSPPGFPGGAQNIASIPGADIIVSINTVNRGLPGLAYEATGCPPDGLANSAFYLDYEDSTDPNNSQLDGMTIPMQAIAFVTCGETYHIKLVIADASDDIYDSYVFFEKHSFSSNASVSVSFILSVGQEQNILFENCGTGTLIFERFGDFSTEEWIFLETTGVAESGIDYTQIPDSLIFPAGDSIITLPIIGFEDNITEGNESVTLQISNVASECNNTLITTEISFQVGEPLPLLLDQYDVNITCVAEAILDPQPQFGYGEYTYLWNTGQTTPTILVSPNTTTTYSVTVGDVCDLPVAIDSFTVIVPDYPPLDVNAGENDTLTSCFDVAFLDGQVSGGDGNYTFVWFTNSDTLGFDQSVASTLSESSTVFFEVTDGCGIVEMDDKMILIPVEPLTLQMSSDTIVCIHEPVMISGFANGGEEPYTFNWEPNGFTGNPLQIEPIISQTYSLSLTDACGAVRLKSIFVGIEEVNAFATINYTQNLYEIRTHNFSTANVGYSWDFGDGISSSEFEPKHLYNDVNNHTITLDVISEIGCESRIELYYIAPSAIYVPSAFTPNADGLNDFLEVKANNLTAFKMIIYDRWGQQVFISNSIDKRWVGNSLDGSYYLEIGVYNYIIKAKDERGIEFIQKGSVTLIR